MGNYKWRGNQAWRFNVEAQAAGEFLEDLSEKTGGSLNARLVLDRSRPEEALLHSEFEWNNEVAAELHREEQARKILRSIVTVQQDSDGEEVQIRAYYSLHEPNAQRSYMPIARVLSDDDLRNELLGQALIDLQKMQYRYGNLKELAEIWEIGNELRAKLG